MYGGCEIELVFDLLSALALLRPMLSDPRLDVHGYQWRTIEEIPLDG